jgi:hypothetical protein
MGNNCAPPLAIIFMDHVERQILHKCQYITYWRRYIDDILVIFDEEHVDIIEITNISNSINMYIQFTHKCPKDGKMLDLMLEVVIHYMDYKYG